MISYSFEGPEPVFLAYCSPGLRLSIGALKDYNWESVLGGKGSQGRHLLRSQQPTSANVIDDSEFGLKNSQSFPDSRKL